jgi:hypothetical protein
VVGIVVDQRRAAEVLQHAYKLASSAKRVPAEWIEATRAIDACPSRTFTVALGTALLARATDPRVDALALKATTTPDAYSARTIAHNVLVPFCRKNGVGLRATGREPLNNQPFFRYDRIDQIDRIAANARPFLPVLVQTCKEINQLDARKAGLALAGFLRERINRTKESVAASLTATAELVELIPIVEAFVRQHSDGGRVGQAVVAAVFDLAFDNVRTGRINDPSRHFTGDVHAMTVDEVAAILAAEARQKPVSAADVRTFANAVAADGVPRALMVALDDSQPFLDPAELAREALAEEGVVLSIAQSIPELFAAACTWNTTALDRFADFPQLLLGRLQEIETSDAAIAAWTSRFAG